LFALTAIQRARVIIDYCNHVMTSVKEGVSAVNLKETQCRSTYHGMYRDMFVNAVYMLMYEDSLLKETPTYNVS